MKMQIVNRSRKITCGDLILKTNHHLSLNYVNCRHLSRTKSYVKVSCFRWNLMMNCVMASSYCSNGMGPVNCCVEEPSTYLSGQVVNRNYFVAIVCFL
jgi:hypothetical protein